MSIAVEKEDKNTKRSNKYRMKFMIIIIFHCCLVNVNSGKISTINKTLAFLRANAAENVNTGSGRTFDGQALIRDVVNRIHGIDIYSILKDKLLDPKFQLPNVSLECKNATIGLLRQINISNPGQIMSLPVTKMIDAWGKVPARVLLGNSMWLGAYDECTDITEAKYCKSEMGLKGITTVTYGSCFPKRCTNEDVAKVMYFVSAATKGVMIPKYSYCDNPTPSLSTGAIITITIMAIILFLCLIGTSIELVEGYSKNNDCIESRISGNPENGIDNNSFDRDTKPDVQPIDGDDDDQHSSCADHAKQRLTSVAPVINDGKNNKISTWIDLMTCFSLLKNTKAILSTHVPKGAITSINGIRVISLTWVILGHYFAFGVMGPKPDNLLNAVNILHRFTFLAVSNAFVSVDSFFLLSGFLVGYLTLKKLGKKGIGYRDVLMMYLHRFIRLTPTLALVILFWTNVLPFLLKGPMSMGIIESNMMSKPCEDYWWPTLLYFNNFYPKANGEGCIPWTWYLANDMQFFILSPGILLLILLIQKVSKGPVRAIFNNFIAIAMMCFLSMLITGVITGYYNMPAIMGADSFPGNPRAKQAGWVMDRLYTKPYVRITPYLVGIFLGYLISNDVTLDAKRGKLISVIGWISATVFALLVIYGPWKVFKEHPSFFNDSENIMYSACHRFVWSCSVAWVIYACHNKYGGLVDAFLSWKIWIPLSRLTYSGYLIHLIVIFYYILVREAPYHYQDSFMVSSFISTVFISYAFSFILAVCVEYPILNLEKILFKR